MKRLNLFGLSVEELKTLFVDAGFERYRGEQVFYWLYNQGSESFDEMTNLTKDLRRKFDEAFVIQHPRIDVEETSLDGTRKFLVTLDDGLRVESVLIPSETEDEGQPKRVTLCVSTQVGCALDCKFCATASMKMRRNLTLGEIVGQYFLIQKQLPRRITNLVYMGMGEPMLNYDNVMQSIAIITHEKTCGVSSNHITISTAGVVDGIMRMADEGRKPKLAISLHSADDATRSMLMPINKKHNLEALTNAVSHYYRRTKRRITYEYILFDGINDDERAMRKLVKLVRRIPSKVNIIPFHQIDLAVTHMPGVELKPTPQKRFERFVESLRSHGITVMVRSSSGKDIHAACGQLAVTNPRKK